MIKPDIDPTKSGRSRHSEFKGASNVEKTEGKYEDAMGSASLQVTKAVVWFLFYTFQTVNTH